MLVTTHNTSINLTAVIQDAAMRIILNNNKKSIGLDIHHCKLSIGHSYKKKKY